MNEDYYKNCEKVLNVLNCFSTNDLWWFSIFSWKRKEQHVMSVGVEHGTVKETLYGISFPWGIPLHLKASSGNVFTNPNWICNHLYCYETCQSILHDHIQLGQSRFKARGFWHFIPITSKTLVGTFVCPSKIQRLLWLK